MSTPRRLHASPLPETGGIVVLDAVASKHARVLRLAEGDAVVLFDGAGREAEARVVAVEAEGVRCEALAPRAQRRVGPRLVLCQCLPKGSKLDDIVRACTELGVAEIHLVASERSVPRLDDGRSERKLARLTKIAREAARQSGRADAPILEPASSLRDVLGRAPDAALKLAFVVDAAAPLDDAAARGGDEAWMVVGPEGGLSPDEVSLLEARGFRAVALGPTTLRVETAAPVAVALALYALGGMRPARDPGRGHEDPRR